MSEPFLAEVKIVGFNFAPRGWAQCDGQILPINQNQSLYSLLGTTYGGDGRTTFALPDLRGRAAVHPGANNVSLGRKAGSEGITLSINELGSHNHPFRAFSEKAEEATPEGSLPARAESNLYRGEASPTAMGADSTLASEGGQSHDNMQPYIVVNFIIALQGVFPSRN